MQIMLNVLFFLIENTPEEPAKEGDTYAKASCTAILYAINDGIHRRSQQF